ncbi:MAG: GFA family protein [Pseudomonas sp.]|nr:GFA family protein [Pseudomonas sp.]MDY0413569.1 GFA family protein [Pseudomonas sp.]NLO54347.1 GFA family protein [Gammaproteobacteria bacterium]
MRGSCLCAGVVYEVDELASEIKHCACTTCRKAHAAAFNTGAAVALSQFRWIQGEDLLTCYESSPGIYRYFCSHCGSQLIKKVEGKDQLILRVATLDDDPKQVAQSVIWTSHAVPWLAYDSSLKMFEKNQAASLCELTLVPR